MEKQILDYTLVPAGLLLMVTYHFWLLFRILNHPNKTVIGFNSLNRRFWVSAMMEVALISSLSFFPSYCWLKKTKKKKKEMKILVGFADLASWGMGCWIP